MGQKNSRRRLQKVHDVKSPPIRWAVIEFSPRRSLPTLQKATQPIHQGRKITPNGDFAADAGIDSQVKLLPVIQETWERQTCLPPASEREVNIKASASQPLLPASPGAKQTPTCPTVLAEVGSPRLQRQWAPASVRWPFVDYSRADPAINKKSV